LRSGSKGGFHRHRQQSGRFRRFGGCSRQGSNEQPTIEQLRKEIGRGLLTTLLRFPKDPGPTRVVSAGELLDRITLEM
jgi:hypothetical protein